MFVGDVVEGRKTRVDHCLHVFIAYNCSIDQYQATNDMRGLVLNDAKIDTT